MLVQQKNKILSRVDDRIVVGTMRNFLTISIEFICKISFSLLEHCILFAFHEYLQKGMFLMHNFLIFDINFIDSDILFLYLSAWLGHWGSPLICYSTDNGVSCFLFVSTARQLRQPCVLLSCTQRSLYNGRKNTASTASKLPWLMFPR